MAALPETVRLVGPELFGGPAPAAGVRVLTGDAEVVVSSCDHAGQGSFVRLTGRNHVTQDATLGRAERRRGRARTCRHIADTDPQVLHHVQLVVGIPDVTWMMEKTLLLFAMLTLIITLSTRLA